MKNNKLIGSVVTPNHDDGGGLQNFGGDQLPDAPNFEYTWVKFDNGMTVQVLNETGHEVLPGDKVEVEVTSGAITNENTAGVYYKLIGKA